MEIKTSHRRDGRASSIGCRKCKVVLWDLDRGAIQLLMGRNLEYGFISSYQKFEGGDCNLNVKGVNTVKRAWSG